MESNKYRTSIKLSTIIFLVIVTAIISGLTAGVIVYTSYSKNTGINYNNVNNDSALKQFLEVYSSVTNDYYEDVNRTEMIEAAIDAMLDYLDDKYTIYMNSTQTSMLNNSLRGEYKGIGVVMSDHTVTEVLLDSPAQEAGLLVGDVIVKFNGDDVTNTSIDDIIEKIKGTDKEISLTVMRGDEELTFKLFSKNLMVPAITYRMIDDTNIGYIRIATFSASVDKQVENALNVFKSDNVTSLIIDLRSNSGGYLKAAENVANLFIEKGKVIYSLKTKNDNNIVKDTTSRKTDVPIIVLVNSDTASASEILAAALKESYGATLVGTKTFGKGKVQQVISLVDGSMAKYTTGKWYTPNNENIDKKGIIPDETVELLIEKDSDGKITNIIDTQLNRAIELLTK